MVEDHATLNKLRARLDPYVVDGPCPVGFVIKADSGSGKLSLLLDRTGFILGRSRKPDDCLEILVRHLGGFSPPPPGAVRLRMRALLGPDGSAVLAEFPLFTSPAAVERRLKRVGYRIVDRLLADVTAEPDGRCRLETTEWTYASPEFLVAGHAEVPSSPTAVSALLLTGDSHSTEAAKISRLARMFVGATGDVADLNRAERLAGLRTHSIPAPGGERLYEALIELSGAR